MNEKVSCFFLTLMAWGSYRRNRFPDQISISLPFHLFEKIFLPLKEFLFIFLLPPLSDLLHVPILSISLFSAEHLQTVTNRSQHADAPPIQEIEGSEQFCLPRRQSLVGLRRQPMKIERRRKRGRELQLKAEFSLSIFVLWDFLPFPDWLQVTLARKKNRKRDRNTVSKTVVWTSD